MEYLKSLFFPEQETDDEEDEMTTFAMGPYEVNTLISEDSFAVIQLTLDMSHMDNDVWYALLDAVIALQKDLVNCISVVVTPCHLVFLMNGCESALSEASYISGRVNAAMTLATGVGMAIEDATALNVPDRENDVCRLREYLSDIISLVQPGRARVIQNEQVKLVPQCWLESDLEFDDSWVLYTN